MEPQFQISASDIAVFQAMLEAELIDLSSKLFHAEDRKFRELLAARIVKLQKTLNRQYVQTRPKRNRR